MDHRLADMLSSIGNLYRNLTEKGVETARRSYSGYMLVGTLMPMIMGYVVIEITERDICSITPCASKEEGIEIANRLLRKLIEEDYELDMHTLAEDGAVGDDYMEASDDEPCAWCNLENRNWDAHVCKVEALYGSSPAADMPVKEEVFALIHEQDTDSTWGSDIELSTDRKELEARMRACWENALESWDINPTAEQSDEYCWECDADSASIIDGSETERWRIEKHTLSNAAPKKNAAPQKDATSREINAPVPTVALVHESSGSGWDLEVELFHDWDSAKRRMKESWEAALKDCGVDPDSSQSSAYEWGYYESSAFVKGGFMDIYREKWDITTDVHYVASLSDTSADLAYNGRKFDTRISVEDLAQRALDLKVGQTLYFKGKNCGAEIADDDVQINGVTCLKNKDLDMVALVFSVVGGGNSFMVDITEYDMLRSRRVIADDIYHYYGNDIFV